MAIVATVAIFSSSITVTSAQAVSETLTYEEFAASANHQELAIAMENFHEKIRTEKKMNLTSTLKSDLGATAIGLTKLTAVASGNNFKYRISTMNLLSPSSSAGDTSVEDYGLKNGLYFGTIATYASANYNFKTSALKRLGKPKATHFTTRKKALLQFIDPMDSASVIYSSSLSMASWNMLGNVTDNPEARYSAVEKTANVKNPNNTDYIFDVKVPATMASDEFNHIHTVVTISGDGKTYAGNSIRSFKLALFPTISASRPTGHATILRQEARVAPVPFSSICGPGQTGAGAPRRRPAVQSSRPLPGSQTSGGWNC